jgi:hypothetical protein
VEQYARYRAPAESGQKLIVPPWSDLGDIASANCGWRARSDIEIGGQSLEEFASQARRELVARAAEHVATYHSPQAAANMAALVDCSRPLILTGHQPEMVHAGVWLKNFAAAALAKSRGGIALNLVIDGDACRSTSIRVPGGTLNEPRFAAVEFDRPAEKTPWEERTVVDERTWQSFAQRVRSETRELLPERILDQWWPTAIERYHATGRIGASLAQARHLTELAWGQESLELPQSQMCQTDAFRRFACHLFLHLPRFVDAYNASLVEYRRVHRIRNHAHPVPNLACQRPWLQAPFWIWSAADPRRRPVYIRREPTALVLSDLGSFERSLPLAKGGDPASAVAELARWESEGYKLRSRALITTMFARLAVADLFIHGIGGAKYDQATDAICQRFFGTAPPPFAAISGTLRLPIAHGNGDDVTIRQLRQSLRELDYHPERFVAIDGPASASNGAERFLSEKRSWIDTSKTPQNAASRHAAITAANHALQPFLAERRSNLETQLATAAEQSRANRVLNSREFSFCLFPRNLLEQFLLDFPA